MGVGGVVAEGGQGARSWGTSAGGGSALGSGEPLRPLWKGSNQSPPGVWSGCEMEWKGHGLWNWQIWIYVSALALVSCTMPHSLLDLSGLPLSVRKIRMISSP